MQATPNSTARRAVPAPGQTRAAAWRSFLAGLVFAPLLTPAMAQADTASCDAACLEAFPARYLEAMIAKDIRGLPWAERVRFTENDVGLQIGDGLWGSGTAARADGGFLLSDPATANVLWLGVVEEHGLPAYLALRLKVEDGRIADVETLVGHEGTPGPFVPAGDWQLPEDFTQEVPAGQRSPRERLIALVEGWHNSVQLNDGAVFTNIDPACERRLNGQSTTQPGAEGDSHWAAQAVPGCQAQLEQGLHKPVDRIRDRRYPLVDEARGIVAAYSLHDHAVRYTEYETLDGEKRRVPVEYPNTLALMELFKIVDGRITRIEGVSVFQPYLMPTPWKAP